MAKEPIYLSEDDVFINPQYIVSVQHDKIQYWKDDEEVINIHLIIQMSTGVIYHTYSDKPSEYERVLRGFGMFDRYDKLTKF